MLKIRTYSNFLNESFTNQKTLYVMRHAKADKKYGYRDYDRPILEKGQEQTQKIANYLKEKNVTIDLILVSPSVRTIETCDIITKELTVGDIRKEKIIYDSDYPKELNVLFNDIPNTVNSVMLIGHNPTITYFVNDFINNVVNDFQTSGVVSLQFNVQNWKDIFKSKAFLNFVIFPNMLD